MIDIGKFRKPQVLAALYNASQPLGLGILHFTPQDMTEAEAGQLLAECKTYGGDLYFDYLKGRVMKVDLNKDTFDPWLYDRDNGEGAAQKVINSIEEKENK